MQSNQSLFRKTNQACKKCIVIRFFICCCLRRSCDNYNSLETMTASSWWKHNTPWAISHATSKRCPSPSVFSRDHLGVLDKLLVFSAFGSSAVASPCFRGSRGGTCLNKECQVEIRQNQGTHSLLGSWQVFTKHTQPFVSWYDRRIWQLSLKGVIVGGVAPFGKAERVIVVKHAHVQQDFDPALYVVNLFCINAQIRINIESM